MMNIQSILAKLQSIKTPSEYLAAYFHEKEAPKESICTACAHVGPATRQMFGRTDVERGLWIILVALAVVYLADMLILKLLNIWIVRAIYKLTSITGKIFLVAGIGYTLVRVSVRTTLCPTCGGAEVIPVDSPRGQKLMQQHHSK
jgi:hypothetical protein